jgi:hypothetical protein
MAKTSRTKSDIDRLIDLASDETKPRQILEEIPPPNNRSLSLEDQKDPRPSMWRVLLQMRVLLPYLARILPLLERGILGTAVLSGGSAPPSVDHHLDAEIEEIQGAHRDLAHQLKTQGGDIQALKERLGMIGASLAKTTQRQDEMAESLASLNKAVKIWAIVIIILLLGLLGATIFLALNHRG